MAREPRKLNTGSGSSPGCTVQREKSMVRASSRGGVGTVYGALIGALIMASLDNGMSMIGVDSFWQMIVKGSILLLAVWVDVVSGAGSER